MLEEKIRHLNEKLELLILQRFATLWKDIPDYDKSAFHMPRHYSLRILRIHVMVSGLRKESLFS
jgi:hypothetical protein